MESLLSMFLILLQKRYLLGNTTRLTRTCPINRKEKKTEQVKIRSVKHSSKPQFINPNRFRINIKGLLQRKQALIVLLRDWISSPPPAVSASREAWPAYSTDRSNSKTSSIFHGQTQHNKNTRNERKRSGITGEDLEGEESRRD